MGKQHKCRTRTATALSSLPTAMERALANKEIFLDGRNLTIEEESGTCFRHFSTCLDLDLDGDLDTLPLSSSRVSFLPSRKMLSFSARALSMARRSANSTMPSPCRFDTSVKFTHPEHQVTYSKSLLLILILIFEPVSEIGF